MIQLPKHQIDGTNSGSRLKIGLTFGTLRKASWLVAKGLVIAEGPRTSRNLTGNALPVQVPHSGAASECERPVTGDLTRDQRRSGDLSWVDSRRLLVTDARPRKLGELPNRSAPIFQEERFFVPSAPAQLPQPLPHPDSRRDSPASG